MLLTSPARPGTGPGVDQGPPQHRDGPAARVPARRRPARPGSLACALAVVGLVVLVRVIVQVRWGDVTGLDTGNWYTFGNAWTGHPLPGGAASTYPPLVPVAVALLGRVLDPFAVAVLMGAAGTVVHGGCAAFVLRRAGVGWWTPALVAALVSGSAVGEMVAWGGFPQLAGLGLALLVLYLVAGMLAAPCLTTALGLGAAGLALGATSHLVLAEAAAVAVAMVGLRALSGVRAPTLAGLRRVATLWAVALAPGLLLVPLYARLAATVGDSFADRRAGQQLAELLSALDVVTRPMPELWRPVAVAAVLVPVLLWHERRRSLWLVTAGLAAALVMVVAVSPEPRFAYLAPLLLVCAGGLVAVSWPLTGHARPARLAVRAVALSCCAAVTVGALALFSGQVRYYGQHVPPGTTAALSVLREVSRPEDVVLVPPAAGMPIGWWVEGYGRRAALVGSSSRWLNFPAERQRAQTSVSLFSAPDVFSDRWFAAARAGGADVVYVPSNYHGLPVDTTDQLVHDHPDLVPFRGRAALIVKVPSP